MHAPDVKAGCVAALLTGLGIGEVATLYKVPKPTVSRWNDELNGTVSNLGMERNWLPARGPDWRSNFEGYVDDALYAMRVQVAYLSRPDVLERTDYAAIVDAHGSLADRIARIADTVGRVDAASEPGLPAPEQ